MQALPFIDADMLTALVSWREATEATERALRAGLDLTTASPRQAVPTASGELLLMPAESAAAVGVKLLSLAPDNPQHGLERIQGLYLLFDAATLTPQLLIDGSALTSLRTPAVSALAVQNLAVADAERLTVFSTGPQAWAHVHAIGSVRAIKEFRVVGRHPGRADGLVTRLRAQGLKADSGTADSVRDADIVICATTSAQPVFDGDLLAEHACVVAIGSHDPARRELDDRVFARATRVVVEDRATALREAGDVIQAVRAGTLAVENLIDLVDLLSRAPNSGISVFKSVGMGWQDLAIAEAAHAGWLTRNDSR